MGRSFVPVTMGSPRSRSVEVGGLLVTEAWFPPGLVIPPHVHRRACFAVMLDGAFDLSFARASYDCAPARITTEPAGERHANRVRSAGAHVVVLQPDPLRTELLRPLREVLEEVHHFGHAGIARSARQVTRELGRPDGVSELAIESLALGMLVAAGRNGSTDSSRRPPPWLLRAQEYVHARFLERFTTADVAREAGVHPVHLARVFRATFRASLGDYVRALRLDWAARLLTSSAAPLAEIALRAGFADQSHFTRAFKRYSGMTPGRYRAAMGEARGVEPRTGGINGDDPAS